MSDLRMDIAVIAGGLLAWIGIFVASAQGRLGVSGLVSDGLLLLVAALIAHRAWRLYRRRGGKDA
jgi:hypothetical protein